MFHSPDTEENTAGDEGSVSNGGGGGEKQQEDEGEVKEEEAQRKEEESNGPESPVKRAKRSAACKFMSYMLNLQLSSKPNHLHICQHQYKVLCLWWCFIYL